MSRHGWLYLTGPIALAVAFARESPAVRADALARTIYVDAAAGDDAGDGLTPETAWRSLARVNATTFGPGDRLLLKAGGRFEGPLWPKGSGAEGRPIVVDRYGSGPKPIIDGGGREAAVRIHNQEHIEIRNLEVTNDAPEEGLRSGVLVTGENLGRPLRHIHLLGLDIRDVRGKLGAEMEEKRTGGIGVEARGTAAPTPFDDLLIEGCSIRSVDSTGIYLWSALAPHPRDPRWSEGRNTNVRVRDNRLSDIGKNAIAVRSSLAPVIEGNVIERAAARFHGNALYVFGCKDALVQRNEVTGTRFLGLEGAAFDSDYNSEGTLIQYNWSRDNGGGLVNLCNNPASRPPRGYNDGTVVRYNVSQNETERVVAFDGPVTNTKIYNNTLYVGPGLSPRIVEFDTFGRTPGYAAGVIFRNNVIVNLGSGRYVMGDSRDVSFDHNCFFGNHPESEPEDPAKLTGDPLLVDPGKGSAGLDGAAGYVLGPESPCRDSGVEVAGNGGRDYSGNPLYTGAPDRGAHELPAPAPRRPWVMPPSPEGVTLEKDVAYLGPERREKLDLYLPSNRPPGTRSPAVVVIHGGGWTGGDKGASREVNIGTTLALAGYVAASVNYQVEEPGRWPTNLLDCKNAVRFLRANAARYGVDPDRIAAMGGSAGGHLALLVAYTSGVPDLEPARPYPGFSSTVQAVVDLYGPTNLLTRQKTDAAGNPTGEVRLDSHLLSSTAAEDEAGWRRASPVSHVRAGLPPTLILHGTTDTTVDRDQSHELARSLEAAGVEHRLILLPGVGHTFDLQRWSGGPLPTDLRPVVIAFLDEHLRPEDPR